MIARGCTYRWLLVLFLPLARAQTVDAGVTRPPTSGAIAQNPPPSALEKWNFFLSETVSPFMLAEVAPDATISQLVRTAPLYGKHFWGGDAFPKRFAATAADDVSRNFFADYLLASAFHEDTRYVRMGTGHKTWSRIGYALSRVLIARTDSGDAAFNWATVGGYAMSAGLSNAYYPAVSRNASDAAFNFGTHLGGAGLGNLMPEFGPDLSHWIKRHRPFHH